MNAEEREKRNLLIAQLDAGVFLLAPEPTRHPGISNADRKLAGHAPILRSMRSDDD